MSTCCIYIYIYTHICINICIYRHRLTSTQYRYRGINHKHACTHTYVHADVRHTDIQTYIGTGVNFTLINLILGFIPLLSFGISILFWASFRSYLVGFQSYFVGAFHSYLWGFISHMCTFTPYPTVSRSYIAQGPTEIHTKIGSRNGAGMAKTSVRISLLLAGG